MTTHTLTPDELAICADEPHPLTPEEIEICAAGAHEANRAYCAEHGDLSQVAWKDAPAWQRASAIRGVFGVLQGNGPKESHESWLAEKRATGWVHGPVKDPEVKTHPCMVPYEELPPEQRHKDTIFVTTVRTLAAALGHPVVPGPM